MHVVAQIHTMSFLKIKHFLLISLVTAIVNLIVSLRVNNNIILFVTFMFNCNCKAQKVILLSITISNSYTMAFLKIKLILFIILFTSNVICQIMACAFVYLLVSLSFHSTILICVIFRFNFD